MASKSVLDIVIRTIKEGGADVATVDGLVKVKNAIMGAAQVAGTLTAAYYAVDKVFDATVGTMVAYADQVRTIQNATGATAESASQLIQILDDQKISFEQLEKVVAKNGKTYDYSIAGIAAMSEEYLKLGSANEQAAFMQERFGKAWIDFVPIMQQGKDAILEQAAAVSDGMVLTQDAVDQAREYEIALDNWNDSVMALKVSIGTELLPAVTNLIGSGQSLADTYKELTGASALVKGGHGALTEEFKAFQAQMERGKAMTEFYSAGLQNNAVAAEEDTAAVQALSAAHQSMLGLITSVANETQSYSAKQAELTAKMEANRAEAEKLYPYQKAELADLNSKYAEMQATYQANADAHSAAMGKIQYDLFMTQLAVGGLTDAEFEMGQQAGLAFGVFDEASVSVAKAMQQVQEQVEAGTIKIGGMQKALELLTSGKYSIDVVVNTVNNTMMGNMAMGGGGSMLAGNAASTGNPLGAGGYEPPEFAGGGVATGPTSGYMVKLHGTEGVFNEDQMAMLAPAGSGNVTIYLTYAPGFSTANAAELERNLMPLIKRGVAEARR